MSWETMIGFAAGLAVSRLLPLSSGRPAFFGSSSPSTKSAGGSRWFFRILVGIAVVFWLLVGVASLCRRTSSVAGRGVWGYKSRVIYETGQVPLKMLSEKDRPYLHRSYPLGYPLLMAWCHSSMGKFNDHLVKLVTYFSALLCFFILLVKFYAMGTPRLLALLFTLFICGGKIFIVGATTLYAECLLLIFLLPGFFMIYEYLKSREHPALFCGLFFLAMSAWIKNEGLVYFCLCSGYLFVDALFAANKKERLIGVSAASVLSAGIFILPWQTCRSLLGIENYDFELSKPFEIGFLESSLVFGSALRRALLTMFWHLPEHGGIWIFAVMFTFFSFRNPEKKTNRRANFKTLNDRTTDYYGWELVFLSQVRCHAHRA